MNILTLEQLLEIHALVIEAAGGSLGLRDLGRLEAVIASQTQNGIAFSAYEKELEDFAVQIATERLDIPLIVSWIKGHTRSRKV